MYANNIKQRYNAVILSCDELMLELFDEQLGDKHSLILNKVKHYLYQLAEQIVITGTNVILDYGFWTLSERQSVKQYFSEKGIITELHYVRVQPELWLLNIKKRNESSHDTKSYYIDENMKKLFLETFEEPSSEEIDLLFDNSLLNNKQDP